MMNKKTTLKPRRLSLKGWAILDDLNRTIRNKAEEGDWSAVPHLIFQSIEQCVEGFDRDSFWLDSAQLYNEVQEANRPTKPFPMLKSREKGKPLAWEYEGRTWY